jgi:hypothetical protein
MYHLLVLGAYGLADGYNSLVYNFKKYFDSISFFPLFIYNDLSNSQEYYDRCLLNCINGTFNNSDDIIGMINFNVKKTHIIYFHNFSYLKYNLRVFNLITYDKDFKLIMINWDASIYHASQDIIEKFDIIYTSHYNLENHNIKPLFTGYLKEKSYKYIDNFYKCDVLFIGTTLYDDNTFTNQNIKRKDILDEICKEPSITLHVYTNNKYISEKYSANYKGYISYDDSCKAFSNALFTLNISPIAESMINGHHYYSERLPQILACESIMISNNNFSGLLEPNIDYIYITNLKELNTKILHYKNNPNLLDKMRENYSDKLHLFNYDNIIDKMILDIQQL